MLFTMIGDWFNNTMAFFFIKLLDTMAYALLSVTYNIFYAVSRLNLFGGGAAGQELYNTFTSRFYNILSIIMVFVFAYELIMLIVDPDGKEKKSSSNLVKDTLISIVMVIVCPTIFKYMAIFQNHVIENNTIGAIILGQNGAKNNGNAGKNISLMVFMSFYHPNETTYSTFFDENGEIRSDAVSQCEAKCGSQSTCEKFRDGLQEWQTDSSMGIGSITGIKKLRHSVGETMEYMWVLSTAAAIITAWFFVAYSIAMGTRAVKLGVLQLISPLPIILRIFPQTRKTFETWFGEIKKTYLEVFIRLAVIFFIIALIQLIPIFISVIFQANDDAGTGLTKCLATVCLVLGMLKFASDAPDLFKTLFSNGSNLFSGLNMSPKIRSHVESNPYAMKAIGAGAGAIGGAVGTIGKAAYESLKNNGATNSTMAGRIGKAALAGLSSMPRGLITGGINGYKNSPTKLTKDSMTERLSDGLNAGQTSYDNRKFKDTRENVKNTLKNMLDPNSGTTWQQDMQTFAKNQGGFIQTWADDTREQAKLRTKSTLNRVFGLGGNDVLAANAAGEIIQSTESMISQADAKNKPLKDEKTAIQGKINAGETYVGRDGREYRSMYKSEKDLLQKYDGISSSTTISSGNGIKISEIETGNHKKLQVIENSNTNEKTIITEDGLAFKIDTSNGENKIVSRTDGQIAMSNAQTTMTAMNVTSMTNQELSQSISSATTQSVSTDASTGTVTTKMVTTSGQEITKVVEQSGETTYKMGNIDIKLDTSGNVQNKTINVANGDSGYTKIDITNASSDEVVRKITAEESKHTVYNIETVYNEIDQKCNSNVIELLNENPDARRARGAVMLKEYKDNYGNFTEEFKRAGGAAERFESKWGMSVEKFLESIEDRNHKTDKLPEDYGEMLKEFNKMMKAEQSRSKMSAELVQKEQERRAAKNKKPDDKK